jgi:hypothetical protein
MSKRNELEAALLADVARVEANFERLMKLEAEMHQRRMDVYAEMRTAELERIHADYGLAPFPAPAE